MLKFSVEGSKGDIYHIEAKREGDNFRMTCTCQAGQNNLYCKHRFALLDGDGEAVVVGAENVEALQDLFMGTDVSGRLAEVRLLEQKVDEATKRLKAAKKALARALHD